jgi:hypothetical protein
MSESGDSKDKDGFFGTMKGLLFEDSSPKSKPKSMQPANVSVTRSVIGTMGIQATTATAAVNGSKFLDVLRAGALREQTAFTDFVRQCERLSKVIPDNTMCRQAALVTVDGGAVSINEAVSKIHIPALEAEYATLAQLGQKTLAEKVAKPQQEADALDAQSSDINSRIKTLQGELEANSKTAAELRASAAKEQVGIDQGLAELAAARDILRAEFQQVL